MASTSTQLLISITYTDDYRSNVAPSTILTTHQNILIHVRYRKIRTCILIQLRKLSACVCFRMWMKCEAILQCCHIHSELCYHNQERKYAHNYHRSASQVKANETWFILLTNWLNTYTKGKRIQSLYQSILYKRTNQWMRFWIINMLQRALIHWDELELMGALSHFECWIAEYSINWIHVSIVFVFLCFFYFSNYLFKCYGANIE